MTRGHCLVALSLLLAAAAPGEPAGPPGPVEPAVSGHLPGPAQTHVVEMRSFVFEPAELEVAVGDTVVWVNRDAAPHTATATDGPWDSGAMEAGVRWSRVVGDPGREAYHCEYHPSMRGVLVARPALADPPDPEEDS